MSFDRADDVQVLEDEPGYEGFFRIRRLRLRHRRFDGGWSPVLSRELFERREAVGVLLYDPVLDAIALVEQFRVGPLFRDDPRDANPWLWELVAGLIDSNESPAAVARRESLEEAGCVVAELEPVLEYFSSPGGSNEYFYLFCGRCDLSRAGGIHGLAEEGEDIRVHVLSRIDALCRLDAGDFRNAHTLLALQWLRLHGEQLRSRWLQAGG